MAICDISIVRSIAMAPWPTSCSARAATSAGHTGDRLRRTDAYPQAIQSELGSRVRHRTSCCPNNRLSFDTPDLKEANALLGDLN